MASKLSSRQWQRAFKKHMKTSATVAEAKEKVNEQFAIDHPGCLASAYKVAAKQLQPKVEAVVQFFLEHEGGVAQWGALSEEERKKPWYYSAFRCHQLEIEFVKDNLHDMEAIATASKWPVKVTICRHCEQQHTFFIHVGVAMLVCGGRMTRQQWKAWANSGGAKGTRSQDVSSQYTSPLDTDIQQGLAS